MVRPAILQIKDIYYPLLAAFGVPANIMTIAILAKGNCGLSKCISVYMVAMAVADLLVMIFNEFKDKYCTKRIATTIVLTASTLACLTGVPMFFSYEAIRVIDNVHWGCRTTEAVYILPAWTVYSWMQSTSVVLLPFFLMALFNSLTVRRILFANRTRRGLRGKGSESQNDPELKNRRKSIVLLFNVSGSFILLWLTAVGSFAATRMSNSVYYQGDYSNPGYIATEAGYLLLYLSSFTNTCIYAVTQRKFRDELYNMLRSPWTLFLELFQDKKQCEPNQIV
ncbi:uncharacterized protein [Scyliorhinus torazame]|uniref:uncharacterized protein isoform X2 n=1 Tax=Scyliorhinus torazame TaxID=75743 RepID=UPI003B5994E9